MKVLSLWLIGLIGFLALSGCAKKKVSLSPQNHPISIGYSSKQVLSNWGKPEVEKQIDANISEWVYHFPPLIKTSLTPDTEKYKVIIKNNRVIAIVKPEDPPAERLGD